MLPVTQINTRILPTNIGRTLAARSRNDSYYISRTPAERHRLEADPTGSGTAVSGYNAPRPSSQSRHQAQTISRILLRKSENRDEAATQARVLKPGRSGYFNHNYDWSCIRARSHLKQPPSRSEITNLLQSRSETPIKWQHVHKQKQRPCNRPSPERTSSLCRDKSKSGKNVYEKKRASSSKDDANSRTTTRITSNCALRLNNYAQKYQNKEEAPREARFHYHQTHVSPHTLV
ncbi:hypothetical protein WH47_10116 [Habropoda laboriosa]|uniref:Uncharacterized protein n=1 Tax=Habropoda laboriosa TaxID=597456 RepID=A0A0L7QMY9_9HYME|nr:hypothetical protein WH47_10116 [Habropoda laboriosa]